MNEFGRFVAELNRNLDQILYTVDRMQSLYRSFQRIAPLWEPFINAYRGTVTTSSAAKRKRKGARRPDPRRRIRR